jgi:N,N-dimethylformamidase
VDEKQIIAYADPWSVAAGDTLDVMVSCHSAGQYSAELVELICGDSRPHGTGFEERPLPSTFNGVHTGRTQPLNPGSYAVLPDLPTLQKVSLCLYIYPTLLARDWQPLACGDGLVLDVRKGHLSAGLDADLLTLKTPLALNRWHQVLLSYDGGGGRLALAQRRLGIGTGERHGSWQQEAVTVGQRPLAACDWLLAAVLRDGRLQAGFNGRLEAPRLVADELTPEVAESLLDSQAVTHMALLGAWDFSQGIHTEQVVDVSPAGRHGWTMQMLYPALAGRSGSVCSHPLSRGRPGGRWLDTGLLLERASGSAFRRLRGEAGAGRFRGLRTFLCQAGESEQAGGSGLSGLDVHVPRLCEPTTREVGYSLYEYHADGSGVHFSSRLRPVLNMKPKTITWSFNADTNITNWLHGIEQPFDVITDEDLHRDGAELLEGYRVVITGTHPEYYTTQMLDALDIWLDQGGRLMYMGGNGFYWRIAYCPDNPAIIEVRRAEDGTRAWIAEPGEYYHQFTGEYGGLWRRLGRPPNQLVGIGFAAQGFDGGTYYRLQPGALDERVSFIMQGVSASDIVGDYGTQGGGAAGEEIDRMDEALGSPAHAICLASSENHRPGMLRVTEEIHMSQLELQGPKVRADMVFFETPSGGAVFSTGSISYAGALAHNGFDNDIARMTGNVLKRFLDEAPFDYPGD